MTTPRRRLALLLAVLGIALVAVVAWLASGDPEGEASGSGRVAARSPQARAAPVTEAPSPSPEDGARPLEVSAVTPPEASLDDASDGDTSPPSESARLIVELEAPLDLVTSEDVKVTLREEGGRPIAVRSTAPAPGAVTEVVFDDLPRGRRLEVRAESVVHLSREVPVVLTRAEQRVALVLEGLGGLRVLLVGGDLPAEDELRIEARPVGGAGPRTRFSSAAVEDRVTILHGLLPGRQLIELRGQGGPPLARTTVDVPPGVVHEVELALSSTTIRGIVVGASGPTSVRVAEGGRVVREVETDAAGEFVVTGVPRAHLGVGLRCDDGYLSEVVAASADGEPVVLTLRPVALGALVVPELGAPVRVSAHEGPPRPFLCTTEVRSAGRRSLEQGTYEVTLTGPKGERPLGLVTIHPGEDTLLEVPGGGDVLAGIVRGGSDGEPLGVARITVVTGDGVRLDASSGPEGAFHITLPPGTDAGELEVVAAGHASLRRDLAALPSWESLEFTLVPVGDVIVEFARLPQRIAAWRLAGDGSWKALETPAADATHVVAWRGVEGRRLRIEGDGTSRFVEIIPGGEAHLLWDGPDRTGAGFRLVSDGAVVESLVVVGAFFSDGRAQEARPEEGGVFHLDAAGGGLVIARDAAFRTTLMAELPSIAPQGDDVVDLVCGSGQLEVRNGLERLVTCTLFLTEHRACPSLASQGAIPVTSEMVDSQGMLSIEGLVDGTYLLETGGQLPPREVEVRDGSAMVTLQGP